MSRKKSFPLRLWFFVLVATVVILPLVATRADHRDGPIFADTAANGRLDIGDIFVFQAPGNIDRTVLIMTVSPFTGDPPLNCNSNTSPCTPETFQDNAYYDIKVDNNGDAIEDITFRVTFGPPDGMGQQDVLLRALPGAVFPNRGILAKGRTGQNLPVAGGGMFRASNQDDPFFFDQAQWDTFAATGAGVFPRPVGQAKNFYGPNANILAIVLEIPRTRLRSAPANPNIGVWARTELNGVQQDREGRPFINTGLIPPFPRNDLSRGERRNAFNAGLPVNDRTDFREDMISVLIKPPYNRPRDMSANPPLTSADGLANFFLPDILTFNTNTAFTTNPNDANGYPNGRRLRDDVIDITLNLTTGGAIPSDNVADDNGDRITDGTMRPDMTLRAIAFPYIGFLNNPAGGPNP